MEGFKFVRSKSNIEGININALEQLLKGNNSNGIYNQYSIKKILNRSIIVFDSNKGKICLVNCVNQYYKNLPKGQNCVDVQDSLFGEFKDCTCDCCHREAIKLWKQLKLIKE